MYNPGVKDWIPSFLKKICYKIFLSIFIIIISNHLLCTTITKNPLVRFFTLVQYLCFNVLGFNKINDLVSLKYRSVFTRTTPCRLVLHSLYSSTVWHFLEHAILEPKMGLRSSKRFPAIRPPCVRINKIFELPPSLMFHPKRLLV